jgi:TRAP-type transport system small permease protein
MTAVETPIKPAPTGIRLANSAMALCLAVMASLVFTNVVLRYGFGKGLASMEELSRLLFVWMVFIGATAAYPLGEHMAFTSVVAKFKGASLKAVTAFIHAMVVLTCVLLAWGAWQQVAIGWNSFSAVLAYPVALLPLPAFISSVVIGCMGLVNLSKLAPLDFGHESEVE